MNIKFKYFTLSSSCMKNCTREVTLYVILSGVRGKAYYFGLFCREFCRIRNESQTNQIDNISPTDHNHQQSFILLAKPTFPSMFVEG